MRPMRWHILNEYQQPLCSDEDKALEFICEYDAIKFAELFITGGPFNPEEVDFQIAEGILYYDGGYLEMFGDEIDGPWEKMK